MRVIATKVEKESKGSSDTLSPLTKIYDENQPKYLCRDESKGISSRLSFHNAVSSSINALMSQRGYSRQRATTHLLQSIRGMNDPPLDSKVIELMKEHGVGFEDAHQILTISEAINISCKEHKLTASQAVDNLTSRLKSLRYVTRSHSPTVHQAELKEFKDEFSISGQNTLSLLKPLPVKEIKKDLHRSTLPSRRKSNRKHHKTRSSKKILCTPHKQNSSFKTIGKHQNNEIQNDFTVTVSDRNTIVKKSKLNNVNKGPVDNNVSTINIKNISSPNNSSKRKRDRDRSQQHTNGVEVVMDDGPQTSKIRRSPSV